MKNKENKRYLNCKYLDAGMDGMLCSKTLCTTCIEFNGKKCKDYISKNTTSKKEKQFRERVMCNIAYCEDTPNEQIEEMAKALLEYIKVYGNLHLTINGVDNTAKLFAKFGITKLPKDNAVVLTKEEYEEYQSFKNGDYCATKCDIHELSFNQMNRISDLENENEKLKNEIKNPNEVLEDRERFRARNEELKKQLENKGKETAYKILNEIYAVLWDEKTPIANSFVNLDVKIREIATREGVEIKE